MHTTVRETSTLQSHWLIPSMHFFLPATVGPLRAFVTHAVAVVNG